MSPRIDKPSGDANTNMHYRTLIKIIGVADRGIRTGQELKPIRASYKLRLNPCDLKPIFYSRRDLPLFHN